MGKGDRAGLEGIERHGSGLCFRSLIERVSEVVLVVEVDGTVGYASPSVERSFGHRVEDLCGSNVLEYLYEEDVERTSEAFAQVSYRPGIEVPVRLRVRCVDDSWRDVAGSLSNLSDDPGVGALVLTLREEPAREATGTAEGDAPYEALIRNGTDLVTLCDEDGTIRYASPSVRETLGYEPEELTGIRMTSLIHPADLGYATEQAARLSEKYTVRQAPVRYRRKDGSWVYLESVTENLLANPDVAGLLVNSRDVTNWVRAEEEIHRLNRNLDAQVPRQTAGLTAAGAQMEDHELLLRGHAESLRNLFEQAAVGIIQLGTDGEWMMANRHFCEMTAFAREELFRRKFRDLVHPEDRDNDFEERVRLAKGEIRAYSVEKRCIRKDGHLVWMEMTVSLVRDSSGDAKSYVLVAEDITERKRSEDALRQSEEHYRAVVEQATEGIFVVDVQDKRILESNAAFRSLLGYSDGELLGKTLYDFVVRDARADVDRYVGRALAEGGCRIGEKQYRCRDGSCVYVEVNARTIRYDGRDVLCCVVRDITERKGVEEALRERTETLEKVNRVGCLLSSELDLQKLVQSVTDEATALTGAKFGAFFYNVADERDEAYTLYTISGVSRGAFSKLPMPRKTGIFGPTFEGTEPVRIADVRKDPRYGRNPPYNGMPEGHLPVASYLAVPVVSRSGETLGGLFFGHPEPGVFGEQEERLAVGLAAQAAIAIDNARLFESVRRSEERFGSLVQYASDVITIIDPDGTVSYESPSIERVLGYEPEALVGANVFDYVHRDDIDRVSEVLVGCLRDGRRVSAPIEVRFRHADGSWRYLEVISSNLVDEPSVGGMVINSRDVTERKQVEASLKRNLGMLLAIHEANRTLSSTLAVEEIASRLLEIMQRVSDLDAAGVYMGAGERRGRAERTVGSKELWNRAMQAPESISARRAVLREERPVPFRLSPQDPEAEPTVGLCLPLRTRNDVVGLLEAYGPESLAEDDTIEILVSLAGQAASALENARLYEKLGEREQRLQDLVGKLLTAQEEERRRVAYEVHDGLAQVAVAAHQHLQVFARRHHWGRPKSQEDLQRILKLVRSTVTESRRIIANLRPTVLDDLGLASAIALEVENLRDSGYRVDFEEKLGDERLPPPVEIALYRVIQEALTNMRKHAQTERACIKLWRQDGCAYAEIRDWGRGFDPERGFIGEGPGERMGLSGMRERVVLLGGDFDVRSCPREGTVVVASIPL